MGIDRQYRPASYHRLPSPVEVILTEVNDSFMALAALGCIFAHQLLATVKDMSAKILAMRKKQLLDTSAKVSFENDEILTLDEAAAFMKMSKRTLYYHVERDSIPFFKAGRLIRFSRQALLTWLSQAGHRNPNSVA